MRTNTGLRIGAAAATAAAGTIVALAVIPGGASAAFDPAFSAQCQGVENIAGRGASFQRTAHIAWGAEQLAPDPAAATAVGFGYATTANGGCASFRLPTAGSNKVTFEPKGSGDGRGAMGAIAAGTAPAPAGAPGVRDTTIQFGAADEPPSQAQISAANNGPDGAPDTADDAVLYTVPVAQSSVAVVVKLPDGCAVSFANHKISRAALEGAFSGATGFTTWGDILPSITGAGCAAKTFKRVVRFDSSGTTFAFKNYLRDIKPTDFPVSLGNTAWPNDTGATAVVRPAVNGAGALLDLLSTQTTDGGIGYADLGAARARNYDTDGTAAAPDNADTSFWLNVERKDGVYESPALGDTKNPADTGSNCKNVVYKDVNTGALPTVKQSWLDVNANASATDYSLCALTYELVWEDLAKANVGRASGAPAYTQGQARAVKDYLGYILNVGGGQAVLPLSGYQALPAVAGGVAQAGSVLAVSQAAQAALTWNRQPVVDPPDGDGDGTPTTPVTVPTTPVTVPTTPVTVPTTPTTPTKPAVPAKPKVTVAKAAALKGRKLTLTVSPSAAGKVSVSATTGSGKKKVTVLSGSGSAKKAGALKITLKPTSKGKKALKAGRSVKIAFKVTFTNAAGKKATVTKTIKVKIKR